MAELKILSVVALLEDVPAANLRRGQVGTIVETLGPDIYEVEFSNDSGETYAELALHATQLLKLYHQPDHQAA
jgi:Domain of unknown function (DUF4926)